MTKKKTETRQATAIDKYIGLRIRAARNAADVSQQELAATLGISFQQIQKYENGSNRVSTGNLALISQTLEIDIAWFFEEAPGLKKSNKTSDIVTKFFSSSGAAELADDFVRLDPKLRIVVRNLAGSL